MTIDTLHLDDLVAQEFVHVQETWAGATKAFLSGDREAARQVMARDEAMDALHREIEDAAALGLVGTGRTASDDELRLLLTIVRIAPELERSGDLATHIAALAAQGLGAWLTPRGRDLLGQMGAVGVEMWRMAADAYSRRDAGAWPRLRAIDDEIDDLHVSLIAELATAQVSIPVAVETGLAARYFERLGDHAVNVTERLRFLRQT